MVDRANQADRRPNNTGAPAAAGDESEPGFHAAFSQRLGGRWQFTRRKMKVEN